MYALRIPSIPRPLLTRLVVVVDCDLGSLQELGLQHPVDPEAEHRVFFVGELEEGCTVGGAGPLSTGLGLQGLGQDH